MHGSFSEYVKNNILPIAEQQAGWPRAELPQDSIRIPTYELIYSVARRHAPTVVLFGSLISVGFAYNQVSILAIMTVWASLAVIFTLFAHVHSREVRKKFGGKILEFIYTPTPMGSLIKSLEKHGVAASSIKSMKLMSADIEESLKYLEKGNLRNDEGRFISDTLKPSSEMNVAIYGYSKCPNVKPNHRRIEIVLTKKRLTEHTNLIVTKNDVPFIWYEPFHDIINGAHYFTRGAYLLKVDKHTRSRVEMEFDKLAYSGTVMDETLAPEKQCDLIPDWAALAVALGAVFVVSGFIAAWFSPSGWAPLILTIGLAVSAIGMHAAERAVHGS